MCHFQIWKLCQFHVLKCIFFQIRLKCESPAFSKKRNVSFTNTKMCLFHTSDIRMTYEYMRVTCVWHTSTYEWHINDIRAYTSDTRMTYEYEYIRVHKSDRWKKYEYIRVTYGWQWHTPCEWFLVTRYPNSSILYSLIKYEDLASLNKYLFKCKF